VRWWVAGLACAATIVAGSLATAPASPAHQVTSRPNVIVVLTDDQSVGELSRATMPHTLRDIAEPGTTFTNSIVSSPLCCPSRAGFLTGEYPHNSGVFDNEPGYASLINKSDILYSWLQAAGYRTGHVGRYLLNYDRPPGPSDPYDPDTNGGLASPPGLDTWFGYVGAQTLYQDATFSDNGTALHTNANVHDYSTREINRQAVDFVRGAEADPRPFFLMVAHLAPHASNAQLPGDCGQGGLPIPERDQLGQFKNVPLPKPPSFDEQAIGDKPNWVRTRPALGHTRRTNLKLGYRCALATLPSVDRGVGQLVAELKREGQLDNTAIFVTSDNGYFFGEHRIFLNKVYPYEEGLRVPLIARVPPALLGPAATRHGIPVDVSAQVNQLDLTATILDLAKAQPCTAGGECRELDGRSLRPLLAGKTPSWTKGRTLLFQIGSNRTCGEIPAERGLNTFYDAIRTPRYKYIELNRVNRETGVCDRPEYELYDLKKDPYELRNIAANPAKGQTVSALQAGLAARLASMKQCAGVAGRDPASERPFCE
jgi:arylsulfatase A-like enzyme